MRSFWHILFTLLLPATSVAQSNLVPNPSFEEYDFCSSSGSGLGWANNWLVPEQGLTPDYFNACSSILEMATPQNTFGFQEPVSGNAYMGVGAYEKDNLNQARESITVELLSNLTLGERYVFSAYFSLADNVLYSVRTLGYKLSETILTGPTAIVDYEPTFYNTSASLDSKENWVRLIDTVTATGGERFLTIANFLADSVSDTLYVGNGDIGRRKAYYYVDDVSLISLDTLLSVSDFDAIDVSIFPNPATENLTIQSKTPLAQVWLTDLTGRRLAAFQSQSQHWQLNVSCFSGGIYLVESFTQNGMRSIKKIVVQ